MQAWCSLKASRVIYLCILYHFFSLASVQRRSKVVTVVQHAYIVVWLMLLSLKVEIVVVLVCNNDLWFYFCLKEKDDDLNDHFSSNYVTYINIIRVCRLIMIVRKNGRLLLYDMTCNAKCTSVLILFKSFSFLSLHAMSSYHIIFMMACNYIAVLCVCYEKIRDQRAAVHASS